MAPPFFQAARFQNSNDKRKGKIIEPLLLERARERKMAGAAVNSYEEIRRKIIEENLKHLEVLEDEFQSPIFLFNFKLYF